MNPVAIVSGIDLLLQFIDRLSAASVIIKKARSEGREPSSEELASVRLEGDALMSDLDAAIAKAKAEGR
jgi:hypothetical protein